VAEAVFVQGDTAPPVIGQILKADGTARDLGDVAEVRFQLRRADDRRYQVDAVAEVTDAPNGWVRYQWAPTDLSVAGGDYIGQWQLTYEPISLANVDGDWTITVAANVVTVDVGAAHGLTTSDTFNTGGTWTDNAFMEGLSGQAILSVTSTTLTFDLEQADGTTTETSTSATITSTGKVQTTTPVNTIEIRRQ
jgi:hypothetical protein